MILDRTRQSQEVKTYLGFGRRLLYKCFDGLGTNLSDRLVVHAAHTRLRAITAAGVSFGSVATKIEAKLRDLVESSLLFAALTLGSATSGGSANALEHPVTGKGLGSGLLWGRFVDIFSSVRGKEDGLKTEGNSRRSSFGRHDVSCRGGGGR